MPTLSRVCLILSSSLFYARLVGFIHAYNISILRNCEQVCCALWTGSLIPAFLLWHSLCNMRGHSQPAYGTRMGTGTGYELLLAAKLPISCTLPGMAHKKPGSNTSLVKNIVLTPVPCRILLCVS